MSVLSCVFSRISSRLIRSQIVVAAAFGDKSEYIDFIKESPTLVFP